MLYTPTRFLCHEDKSQLKFENKLLLFYTFEGKKIAWWKIIILLEWLIKIANMISRRKYQAVFP